MRKGILFATVLGVSVLFAAPGDMDTTFGIEGKVTTDFDGGNDKSYSVAIQDDGKIVVVGDTYKDTGTSRTHYFALARYNTNGELDTTFGVEGKVTTDFGGSIDSGYSVTIQDDGKIVVAGNTYTYNGTSKNYSDFALARYNTNGELDTTFGVEGKVTTDFVGGSDYGYSVTIQDDGKIVVAGKASTSGVFALARYNTNGGRDATFGTGGKVTTDFDGDRDEGRSVTIQDNGKIVVAGTTYGGNGASYFALARYNTNGALDTTFGIEGKVTTDFTGLLDFGYSVAIQDDGKIVVAGYNDNIEANDIDFLLARYNTNGELDATFGIGGKVIADFAGIFATIGYSVAIQDNGKIVVAGYYAGNGIGFALARYDTDGRLDEIFGNSGLVTTNYDKGSYGRAVAIQDDGKIVVSGDTYADTSNGYHDFALARYEGDPTRRVDIDIIPNKSPNVINYKIKKGECQGAKLKVDTLSTSDFDVTQIDPLSVMLSDPKLVGKATPIKVKIKDVNRDGYDDIQFTFSICDMVNQEVLNADTTKLILTGETPDGIIVTGKDTVEVEQK